MFPTKSSHLNPEGIKRRVEDVLVPLDMTKECDRAYLRCYYRRCKAKTEAKAQFRAKYGFTDQQTTILIPTLKSVIICKKCGTKNGHLILGCKKCGGNLPSILDVAKDPTLGTADPGDLLHARLIQQASSSPEFLTMT